MIDSEHDPMNTTFEDEIADLESQIEQLKRQLTATKDHYTVKHMDELKAKNARLSAALNRISNLTDETNVPAHAANIAIEVAKEALKEQS